MKHPISEIIDEHYGTMQVFAKRMKIHRHTASKYYKNPDVMPFGIVVRICKHAGINIKQITTTTKQNETT
jgi:hypothetical protein